MAKYVILYASETGTAEDAAFKVLSYFQRSSSCICAIHALDNYPLENLPDERRVIFVTSTMGDGEVPSNMRNFWKFLLQKGLPSDSLDKLEFTVFGLGDSGYDKFNAAARRLNSRLKQLGAKEVVPIGLGDDQSPSGYLGAFDPWMSTVLELWCHGVQFTNTVTLNVEEYSISLSTLCPPPFHLSICPPSGFDFVTPLTSCTVLSNTRLTTLSWTQNVFHIALDVYSHVTDTSPALSRHTAGDVLVVYPHNPPSLVELSLSLYSQWDPSSCLQIHRSYLPNMRKNRLPDNISCTLRDLFSRYLDISGVPQRGYFEALSHFSSDDEQRDKLVEISSAEGADLYYSYCVRERRSYIDVLSEFRSCNVPLSRLLELIPPLSPRHYSIASSAKASCLPEEVHLCIALVQYTTPLGRSRLGICSSYLSSLLPGDTIDCCIRKGSFPPPLPSDLLLLVGPGTGVAPMRAFLQERSDLCSFSQGLPSLSLHSPPPAHTLFFFGCRSADDDYLYHTEWEYLNSHPGNRVKVITAFSRQGGGGKQYVTDCIRSNGAAVWNLIRNSSARIYIAGSASTKMPADVRRSLVEVICSHSDPSVNTIDAEKFLLRMEREKRFCVEAWS